METTQKFPMSPIDIALAVYGTIGTSVSIVEAVLSRTRDMSADELFKECFKRSVKRNAKNLSIHTETKDPASVYVDDVSLDRVMVELEARTLPFADFDSLQIRSKVAEYFANVVILEGHSLTQSDFHDKIEGVLDNALQDFISKLPFNNNQAYREVVLEHISKEVSEQQEQELHRLRTQEMLTTVLENLQELRELQETLLNESEYLRPELIQRESGWSGYRNPFRLLKAEDFDDPIVFSNLFEVPSRYDLIRGPESLILEGGRGCGKSMILKSLAASVALQLEAKLKSNGIATFAETELEYFGVYIKLARGCFDDARPDAVIDEAAATQFFQHYFNMELLKATIETLISCREQGTLQVRDRDEKTLAAEIAKILGQSHDDVESLQDLRDVARSQQRAIRDFLAFRRIGEDVQYKEGLTYVYDFPRDFCLVLTEHISDLSGKRVYFLLDEFENLAKFQQTVVNTIVKLRPEPLSIKVATRARGVKSEVDLNGEPIQVPRDYQVLPLDYDSSSGEYTSLLSSICERRLKAEGYSETNVRALLPSYEPYAEFGGEPVMLKQVSAQYEQRYGEVWNNVPLEKQRDYVEKWATTLIFRERHAKRYPKNYAGFSALATISSGIVSNFLDLCKNAFYLAEASGYQVREGEPIPRNIQNEAVYITSQVSLDWIPRNIPETGSIISRLVRDLADIFKKKLLNHNSEPEAARIAITDPARLRAQECMKLREVLEDAVRWSVFHDERSGSYLARHLSSERPEELVLNRILIPALKISHRYRWRTLFTVEDLAHLIDEDLVGMKKQQLVNRHSGRDLPIGPDLFSTLGNAEGHHSES